MNVFPMEYSTVYFQNDTLRLNIPVIFKMKIEKYKLRDFLGYE